MAREIADFNGTVFAPDGTYPYGRVRNAPLGTIVDETMIGDTIQFTQKLMAEAGVTPNGDPDNNSDGWQIYEAFETLSGRAAWGAIPSSGAGSTTFTAVGGGSITVDAADRVYERFQVIGKTLRYQLNAININLSGTVTSIDMNLTILGALVYFTNVGGIISGVLNLSDTCQVVLNGSAPQLTLKYQFGSPFPVTASMALHLDITAELN